jgi:MFS family permease
VSTQADRDRRGWIIVGAIFVTMFFIWGAINSGAVFFVPILKHFGWSRTKLSIVLSIGWVTGGAAGPVIGWLADRIDPKKMMAVGAIVTGLAWLTLSRATNFGEFLAIYGLSGICVGASTIIPSSIIIASWFQQRRGLAMGIAFAGTTLGGAVMTVVASHAIASGGWRFGYLVIGLPILVVVVPLIVIFVRTRTPAEINDANQPVEGSGSGADEPSAPIVLPGLEIAQARKTRSFWMICVAQLLGGLTIGMGPHFVAYLTGIGYSPTFAATVISLYLVVTTAGTLLGGPFADRLGARSAMMGTYLLGALGMFGLFEASHPWGLALNIIAGGFAAGALAVQMPLVMIESLGIKRFGSVMGITSIFGTAGAAVSPVVTGRIFDNTGSYAIVIASFVVMLMVCSIAVSGCRTLEREQTEFAPRPQEAAA